MLRVGLFSSLGDKETSVLKHRLDELAPGACGLFAVPDGGVPRVGLDRAGVYWDGVNVAELQCAYLRGLRYANPTIPRAIEDADWTLWQTDYITDQQRASFLHSAFTEMVRRGVRLFNSPAGHVRTFALPHLLETLRGLGFAVPRLFCSNDPDAAEAFCTEIGATVWRPATGRAPWQRCTEYRRQRLIAPDKPPILIAEVIEGPLIRAYLFAGEPVLCVKTKAPAFVPPLERLEVFMTVDYPEASAELRRLAEAVDLSWAVVSFVMRDSRPWLYGLDPDPLYADLPGPYRERVVTGLARGLLGDNVAALETPAEEPQPRANLFLRRMLQPLFEIEHRKYHPGL